MSFEPLSRFPKGSSLGWFGRFLGKRRSISAWLPARFNTRQKRIGVPIRIELNLGRSGGGNAVGIREETEQIIEAVILEIDDDDVLDIAELRG